MKKYIISDIYGVLLINEDFPFELNKNTLFRLIKKYAIRFDLGKLKLKTMLDEYNKIENTNFSVEKYIQIMNEHIKTNKELIKYLNKLKKQNIEIILLSNNYKENVAFIENNISTIKNLGNKRFYSCKLNMRKPNKNIFLHILKKINAEPKDCLFIDDKKENVDAAKKIGIEVIQHKNNENTIKKLKNILEK